MKRYHNGGIPSEGYCISGYTHGENTWGTVGHWNNSYQSQL